MPRHVDSIKCGSCRERHTTVAQVQLCYQAKAAAADLTRREEFDAQVEAMAEQAGERWFEERGGPVEDDRIEREAWAREDELRSDVLIQQREIAQDQATAEAKMMSEPFVPRSFSLDGTDRRRPW